MDLLLIDEAVVKMGSRFKLSVLLQKRARELVRGAVPLVDTGDDDSPMHVALLEVMADKVKFELEEKEVPVL